MRTDGPSGDSLVYKVRCECLRAGWHSSSLKEPSTALPFASGTATRSGGQFFQVLLFISKIVVGVAEDGFCFGGFELAAEFAGRSHPKRAGFDDGALGDQG